MIDTQQTSLTSLELKNSPARSKFQQMFPQIAPKKSGIRNFKLDLTNQNQKEEKVKTLKLNKKNRKL
jgi:hypothetical protein